MYRKRKNGGPKESKLEIPETLELYNKGLNDQEMAKALGCSPCTVFSWRKRHCKPPNANKSHGPRASKLDYQETLSLYRAGFSDKDMAERLGCTPATVSTWRKRHQLLANGKPGRPRKDGKNENDSRGTPGAGPGDDDEHRKQ